MPTKIDDGGPAFPYREEFIDKDRIDRTVIHPGMTLLAYYTGQAMKGAIAGGLDYESIDHNAAQYFIGIAEILIYELRETEKGGSK